MIRAEFAPFMLVVAFACASTPPPLVSEDGDATIGSSQGTGPGSTTPPPSGTGTGSGTGSSGTGSGVPFDSGFVADAAMTDGAGSDTGMSVESGAKDAGKTKKDTGAPDVAPPPPPCVKSEGACTADSQCCSAMCNIATFAGKVCM
jgi:hypothetical protein